MPDIEPQPKKGRYLLEEELYGGAKNYYCLNFYNKGDTMMIPFYLWHKHRH
mgnify:CR=1 FL=1